MCTRKCATGWEPSAWSDWLKLLFVSRTHAYTSKSPSMPGADLGKQRFHTLNLFKNTNKILLGASCTQPQECLLGCSFFLHQSINFNRLQAYQNRMKAGSFLQFLILHYKPWKNTSVSKLYEVGCCLPNENRDQKDTLWSQKSSAAKGWLIYLVSFDIWENSTHPIINTVTSKQWELRKNVILLLVLFTQKRSCFSAKKRVWIII